MNKIKKEITKDQFYQLFGLCLANIQLNQKTVVLADAWEEIVGKDNRDRFWDFYDSITEKELIEKLGYDNVFVKTKRIK